MSGALPQLSVGRAKRGHANWQPPQQARPLAAAWRTRIDCAWANMSHSQAPLHCSLTTMATLTIGCPGQELIFEQIWHQLLSWTPQWAEIDCLTWVRLAFLNRNNFSLRRPGRLSCLGSYSGQPTCHRAGWLLLPRPQGSYRPGFSEPIHAVITALNESSKQPKTFDPSSTRIRSFKQFNSRTCMLAQKQRHSSAKQ